MTTCAGAMMLSADPDGDLLQNLQRAHRSAVESIRTFSCRVESSSDPPSEPNAEENGQYWRSGNSFRIRRERQFHIDNQLVSCRTDLLVRDGKSISLSYLSPPGRLGPAEASIERASCRYHCDAWALALINFLVEENRYVPFQNFLASSSVRDARWIQEGGRDLVCLEADREIASSLTWFDPQVNYLVRKQVVHIKPQIQTPLSRSNKFRAEREVLEFREYAPGVFFPAVVEWRSYQNGKLHWTRRTRFLDVQVNRGLSPDMFQIRFPPGIVVRDAIRGSVNRTDQKWQPTLVARNEQGHVLQFSREPPLIAPAGVTGTVTAREPVSWTWWILPASLLLLVLVAGIKAFRQWSGV
jgi:hypothetical protein